MMQGPDILLPRSSRPPPRSLLVAGLGQASIDYLCRIEKFPDPDTKCEFEGLTIQGGGPVATALVALARWGVSSRFAGVVCSDGFGEAILEGLRREGIDTSAVWITEGKHSQFAFICVEREGGRRTIFWGRPDASPYPPEAIPEDFLEGALALHLDGLFMEASLALARKARQDRIPVVLDAGTLRPGMLELVRLTDHLVAAETFFQQYSPGSSARARLQALRAMGPQVVTVTLGEKGSISLWEEETPYLLPSLAVRAEDTTGAGDVFHGAYIYALLQGWNPAERIRWATAAAGLSCRSLGGRSGIPSVPEVNQSLSSLRPFSVLSETTIGLP